MKTNRTSGAKHRLGVLLSLLFCNGIFCNPSALAALILVPGTSPTIQGAIDQASAGDEIRIRVGLYEESLVLKSNVTLKGGYESVPDGPRDIWGQGTIVDAPIDPNGFPVRAAVLENVENVVIDGLHFTGGNHGTQPVRFQGGGLYIRNVTQSVRISNCIIRDNFGGVRGFGITTRGSSGGGIYCENASPRIENCSITGNTATGGAGIYVHGGAPLFINCVLYGNVAAGYSVHAGPVTTIVPGTGGGFAGSEEQSRFVNCLFYGNRADLGGGLYRANGTMINSIVWANDPTQLSHGQIVLSASVVQGGYPGAIDDNPMFANEMIGNWRPAKFSPLIDAGSAVAESSADMFGVPRGYNGFSGQRGDGSDTDIGPLEYLGELHGNNDVPFAAWKAYE